MHFKYAAAALAAVLPLCSAQTYTTCNPLHQSCPANKGLAASSYMADFTQASALSQWKISGGSVPVGPQGAEFTVAKKGDAPTIETDFYFFFGKAEVVMKAAHGTGIVSSIVLESDDLDEIDWEALGGDTTHVQTNYFGKGDISTYDRATYVGVGTPQDTFHTYTVDWTKDYITWAIDGAVVRTLNFNDAKGGTRFPQTPMRLRLGSWAGGDPDNGQGTIDWAGGLTDYSKGPYTMYVKSVHIENSNPAGSYTYADNSGSWQSIKVNGAVDPPPNPPTTTSAPGTTSSETTSSTTSSSSSSSSSSSLTTAQPPSTTLTTTTKPTSQSTPTPTESGSSSGSSTGSGSTTADPSTSAGSSSSTPGTTPGPTPSGSSTGSSSSTRGSGSSSGSASTSGPSSGASPTSLLFPGAASPLKGSYTTLVLVFGVVVAILGF